LIFGVLGALDVVLALTASPTHAPTQAPTPLLPDVCFNMGHKPASDYVIKKGKEIEEARLEYDLKTTIFAWLEQALPETNCSAAPHNWTLVGYQIPAGLEASVVQQGKHQAELLNASNTTNELLSIEWICRNPLGLMGLVNVTIALPGSPNVTFTLEKRCFPHISPTPEKPTGWSPASVFFFTVFILTTVFCIVGCGVNYVQKGKTGIEIIPGATTCVDCMSRVLRRPRYTPQMDYDAPVGGPTERFGGSYQTDL